MTVPEFLSHVCQVLNRPPGSLTVQDTRQTIAEWDSLGHLAIIGLVDSLFDLSLLDQSLQDFDSIDRLIGLLKEQGLVEEAPA